MLMPKHISRLILLTLMLMVILPLISGCSMVRMISNYRRDRILRVFAGNDIRTARKLIQIDPKIVEIRGSDGRTPLLMAVDSNDLEMARLLLDHGANANAQEKFGWGWFPLGKAIRHENIDMMKLLIAHGADVNARRRDGWVLLHTAAYHGRVDIIRLLVSHGADVNLKTGEHMTPLYIAAQRGKAGAVKFFIDHGAEIDARTTNGKTPLYETAFQGYPYIANLLVSNGADVNARTKDNITPLKVVEDGRKAFKLKSTAEMLIDGEVPRDWDQVRTILLKHGAKE